MSVPARFADEVLGTLTVGYRLTDGLPRNWPAWRSARSSCIAGTRVAASSLKGRRRAMRPGWSASCGSAPVRRAADVGSRGPTTVTSAASSRSAPGGRPRPAGWCCWPTGSRPSCSSTAARPVPAGGLVVFGLALVGGVILSRHLSRPLRDIATAAADDRRRQPRAAAAGARQRRSRHRRARVQRHERQPALGARAAGPRRHPRPADAAAQPRAVHGTARARDGAPGRDARTTSSRCCSSTSIASSTSTTASATPPATGCCSRSPSAWRAPCARDDVVTRVVGADADGGPSRRWRASAATSSWCCSTTSASRSTPCASPSACSRWRRCRCRSTAQDVFASASIGVAVCSPDDAPSGEDVIRDADLAMYRAKNAGGGALRGVRRRDARGGGASGCASKPTCGAPSSGTSSACGTSRSSRSATGRSSASRRWCAGSIPSAGLLGPGAFLHVAEELGADRRDRRVGAAARRAGRAASGVVQRADLRAHVTVSVNLSAKAFGMRVAGAAGRSTCCEATGLRRARPATGDHRERRPSRMPIACRVRPGAAARARRARQPRRLRHRLLLAQLPAAAAPSTR